MDTNEQIAVFLDIENFIGFSHALKLPLDLSDILETLKEEGRIIIRRSFGDLVQALAALGQSREASNVRRMLRDNLFIHEDIAYHNQFKNAADMRLTVEALSTAFTVTNISKFVVIAADSDYVPLFQKLQELNKTVIGISGNASTTAVIYRRACDSIYYLEDILGRPLNEVPLEDTRPASVSAPGVIVKRKVVTAQGTGYVVAAKPPVMVASGAVSSPPRTPFDPQALRDEYANLLVRAVKILEQSGKPSTMPALAMQMRQLQADFKPERAGFDTLQDLARFAAERRLIVTLYGEVGTTIHLPGDEPLAKETVSTAHYRKKLQDRLKCQLSASSVRKMVCARAFDIIRFNVDDGGIPLRALSMDVTDDLTGQQVNVPQPEVYKYLYSLFRSRCFQFNEGMGDYNPVITGFNAQQEEWDDRFVASQTRLLSQDGLPLFPKKLSALFYETEEETRHVKQLLERQGLKYEAE